MWSTPQPDEIEYDIDIYGASVELLGFLIGGVIFEKVGPRMAFFGSFLTVIFAAAVNVF